MLLAFLAVLSMWLFHDKLLDKSTTSVIGCVDSFKVLVFESVGEHQRISLNLLPLAGSLMTEMTVSTGSWCLGFPYGKA